MNDFKCECSDEKLEKSVFHGIYFLGIVYAIVVIVMVVLRKTIMPI